MRINLIINRLEIGGAQRVILTLGNYLIKQGYQVSLVSIDNYIDTRLHGYTDVILRLERLTGFKPVDNTLVKCLMLMFLSARLWDYMKRQRVQIQVSFMERANLLNLMTPGYVRRIICVRNYVPYFFKRKNVIKRALVQLGYKVLLERADVLNFNSIESMLGFRRLFNVDDRKVSVIHNMCDYAMVQRLGEAEIDPEIDRRADLKKVVLSVGRLVPQKGQGRLIRSFFLVSKADPNAELWIIGGGPERRRFESLAQRLGLGEKVVFLGPQANPYPYIKKATVFVLTSLNEGFPNALLEAMAMGKPIVSTDCSSGPREILAPDTDCTKKTNRIELAKYGILTPPFRRDFLDFESDLSVNEKLLADAIILLLKNQQLRSYYENISFMRIRHFSPEEILPQWINLFNNVLFHCTY